MMIKDVNLEDLPRFKEWRQTFSYGKDFTLMDYLYAKGDLDIAIAFSELYLPEIVKVHGCYFRKAAYRNSSIPTEKDMPLDKRQQAERLVNHLHIYDLFSEDHPNTSLEVEENLARTLVKSWSCAAKVQFPEVHFSFDFRTEPEAYGPTITFWQT